MNDANLIRWWWNGRWGKLARYDVKVYTEGSQRWEDTSADADGPGGRPDKVGTSWRVEAWTGGVEGKSRIWDHLDAEQTRALFADLTEDGDWQDMTPLGKTTQS